MSMPKILTEIAEALRNHKVEISEKVEGEGRGGSLKDEGTIKKYLQSVFGEDVVMNVPARGAGDILVKDGDTIYPLNIKTTFGSTDNATSKIGFLYALTDIDYYELPKSIGWKKFNELLKERKAEIEGRDYYYLCVDKNDSSSVLIRGAKQINCYCLNANPSNMLQIDWKKEKQMPPKNRTYDEAYDTLVGGIKKCIAKFLNNLPEDWLKEL